MSKDPGYLPTSNKTESVSMFHRWAAAIFIFLISTPLGWGLTAMILVPTFIAISLALSDLWKLFMHRMGG